MNALVPLAVAAVLAVAHRIRPRPHRLLAFSPRPPNRRRSRRALAAGLRGGIVAVVVLGGGPLAAVAAVMALAARPRLHALLRARRAARAVERAFPDLVDLVVLGIRSGCTPRLVFERSATAAPDPVRSAMDAVVQLLRTGSRFADAVEVLCRPPPVGLGAVARPLVDALTFADRYGTPLTAILDRVADEARAQRRRAADAAARRLPIQLSFPLVGCTLPSFVLLAIVPLMAGTFSSLRDLAP